MIAGVAETRRLPFDLPEAESELVAGFHTEYSGMKFGMFFVGEYLGVMLISALIVRCSSAAGSGPSCCRRSSGSRSRPSFFICFFILLRAVAAAAALRPVDGAAAGRSCCRSPWSIWSVTGAIVLAR